jgi:hypothetical protein
MDQEPLAEATDQRGLLASLDALFRSTFGGSGGEPAAAPVSTAKAGSGKPPATPAEKERKHSPSDTETAHGSNDFSVSNAGSSRTLAAGSGVVGSVRRASEDVEKVMQGLIPPDEALFDSERKLSDGEGPNGAQRTPKQSEPSWAPSQPFRPDYFAPRDAVPIVPGAVKLPADPPPLAQRISAPGVTERARPPTSFPNFPSNFNLPTRTFPSMGPRTPVAIVEPVLISPKTERERELAEEVERLRSQLVSQSRELEQRERFVFLEPKPILLFI